MKKVISILVILCLFFVLGACSGSSQDVSGLKKDDKSDKGMKVIGENVKFNPNKLVNKGEPIAIELWTWGGKDVFQKQVDKYQKIYPNVKIKVVNQPWEDYWTKLPLQLKGKNGPAMFNFHNSYHSNTINFMAPYDIPTKALVKDYIGVPAHEINGSVYYIDYALNSGNIYYNKKMWKAAGLTDSDIPKTWDQFIKVAQKLTKKDNKGKIIQSGFDLNGDGYKAMIAGLGYQKGELLFKEDGKTVNFYNKTTIENTKMLYDLYKKYEVGSPNFSDDSTKSFGNEQSAMVYKWGWMEGELKNNYPDVEWGVFQTPTPSKDTPFAYDRYNGESTPGINKNAPKDQQAVAQDFLKFLLAGEEFSKEFSLFNASFPAKKSLSDDPDILADPVLKTLAPNIDHYIWPGAFPAPVETVSGKVAEEIFYNDVDIKSAIKSGQVQMEKDMKNANFKSVESKYKFFSKNQ
ncbi:sugar ABC transporter substrate-binding protein [Priestia megaterium]|uniref:extracellular solute-binding protein n=1 Tax=Priestia megaterium TaxID=1404 RepID=UPI000BF53E82|nr:extracellular solute-binding protein [Priestia megaterium]PFI60670.1 sugar ABC transporter substrate-binding protein [Priestia megaterium]PFV93111.1 sugar ABC transporter substrate-binding protein [Priestia megaterium]